MSASIQTKVSAPARVPAVLSTPQHCLLQRAPIHPSPFSPHTSEVPPLIHDVLRSPGLPLDAEPKAAKRTGTGWDFSRVRVGSTTYPREIPLRTPLDLGEGGMSPHLQQIVSGLGPGEPLSTSSKDVMRGLSRIPLDGIRVHDDRNSRITAGLIGSEAFTVGNHIILGDPETSRTPRHWLLAHEVAHTIQQHPLTNGTRSRNPERDADQFANQAMAPSACERSSAPEMNPAPVGLARRVIWKNIQNLPGDLLLILDVDDGDFVGGCVKAIVPHVGVKLIQKSPHIQLFNLHVGFMSNAAGQSCIFFYESVTGICEIKCYPSQKELLEAWEEIKEWLKDLLKKVLEALAIAALVVAIAILVYLIVEAIIAALALLALVAA
jgi:hypothetical protein